VLNDLVIIISQKDKRLITMRELSELNARGKVNILERIRDKNFVLLLDRFSFKKSYYIIIEHEISDKETLLITLSQFSLISPYLNEF
jgi:hypothetical protein